MQVLFKYKSLRLFSNALCLFSEMLFKGLQKVVVIRKTHRLCDFVNGHICGL